MPKCALFLDRDGTINFDSGYVKNPNDVILLPGVAEGIKYLKDKFNLKIIVISNQAGIAYGIMTHDDVKNVNEKINALLKEHGTSIDAFYYCPYHPQYSTEEESKCRKPSPYMIVKAAAEYKIDLGKSYMIGDKSIDVLCGINAGVKTILITNDNTEINVLHNQGKKPNFVAANFKTACDYIDNDFPEAVN
ncbi:MAG: HAD family hydrolase [Bacteroidota bacterium]